MQRILLRCLSGIFLPDLFIYLFFILENLFDVNGLSLKEPRSDPTQYQLNFILNGIKWCSIDCLNEYGNDTAAKFLNQWGTID